MTAEEVLQQFNIPDQDVLCVYPYGSRVYGCHTEESDHDWIVVYKSALLPSGSFRDNAISSEGKAHQAICYSRSGFRNAIDTYEIGALECMFLRPTHSPLMERMAFPIRKWVPKEMIQAIISKSSASWYIGKKTKDEEFAKKNIYHALRVLRFGIQMALHKRMINYSISNEEKQRIFNDPEFSVEKYNNTRNKLTQQLRSIS